MGMLCKYSFGKTIYYKIKYASWGLLQRCTTCKIDFC